MRSLSDLGRDIQKHFIEIDASLSNEDTEFAEAVPRSNVQNESERFQLVSVNLGLFDQGHTSLEYRLQDAFDAREYVYGLLEELDEYLGEVAGIVTGTRINEDDDKASDEASQVDTSEGDDRSSSDAGNSEVEDEDAFDPSDCEPHDFDENGKEEARERMATVADILDRLYRAASRIRKPAIRSSQGRRNLYNVLDPEYKEIMVERLTEMEALRVSDWIHQMRKDLDCSSRQLIFDVQEKAFIRRLGKANSRRRLQFMYWRRRQDRSTRLAAPPVTQLQKHEPIALHNAPDKLFKRPRFAAPSATFTQSSVTKLRAGQIDFTDKSTKYSKITKTPSARGTGGEKVGWPSAPSGLEEGAFFSCPYCFTVCPDRYRIQHGWKAHLIHDLRPYCCTYEDCEDADQLYDSWQDWVTHEMVVHNNIWCCLDHPEDEFANKEEYSIHVNLHHAAQKVQLLSPQLLAARKATSSRASRLCPFCLEEFVGEQSFSVMQHHLAWHLETLALMALPQSTGLEEGSEQGGDLASDRLDRAGQDSRIGDGVPVWEDKDNERQDEIGLLEQVKDALKEGVLAQLQSSETGNPAAPTALLGNLARDNRERQYVTMLTTEEIDGDECLWDGHLADNESIWNTDEPFDVGLESIRPDLRTNFEQNLQDHWALRAFEYLSATKLPTTRQTSRFHGVDQTGYYQTMQDTYTVLLDISFGTPYDKRSDVFVRFYLRLEDRQAQLLCTDSSQHDQPIGGCLPLESLRIHRHVSSLAIHHTLENSQSTELWLSLRFSTFENMAMFHGTFLALRAKKKQAPLAVTDPQLDGEETLFEGQIVGSHRLETLRIMRDQYTKTVRLYVTPAHEPAVPSWTAFVTHWCLMEWNTWVQQDIIPGSSKLYIGPLLNFKVFHDSYKPRLTSDGLYILDFTSDKDLKTFMDTIEELTTTYRQYELDRQFSISAADGFEELDENRRLHEDLTGWFRDQLQLRGVVNNIEDGTILSKLEDLNVEKTPIILTWLTSLVFDWGFLDAVPFRAYLLKSLITSNAHEQAFLKGISLAVGKDYPELLPSVAAILKALYEHRVISEQAIRFWVSDEDNWLIDMPTRRKINAAAKPIVPWLDSLDDADKLAPDYSHRRASQPSHVQIDTGITNGHGNNSTSFARGTRSSVSNRTEMTQDQNPGNQEHTTSTFASIRQAQINRGPMHHESNGNAMPIVVSSMDDFAVGSPDGDSPIMSSDQHGRSMSGASVEFPLFSPDQAQPYSNLESPSQHFDQQHRRLSSSNFEHMTSGLQAIGLALALFSEMLRTVQSYQDRITGYEIVHLIQSLEDGAKRFQTSIEEFMRPFVEAEELRTLCSDPDSALWEDVHLDQRVHESLGTRSHELFQLADKLHETLAELKKQLPLLDSPTYTDAFVARGKRYIKMFFKGSRSQASLDRLTGLLDDFEASVTELRTEGQMAANPGGNQTGSRPIPSRPAKMGL